MGEGDIITLSAGQYRLCAPLAGSAYGVVWRASAPNGAEVALKLINEAQMGRADSALQGRWSESAQTEIAFLRALAPWDQRHIVRLLDSGAHAGLPVMALELLGPDLSRLERASPPPLAQTLAWLGQINQALATVHQCGWLYLDLKPANVLTSLTDAGVRLADFGTSRLRAAMAPGAYTGTASWQAPEQFFPSARNTYDTDTRSDYFALGALFYYLLTGGAQLRFGAACGDAWRAHQSAAPAHLLAAHGGRMPDTLTEGEADLVAHQVGSRAAGAALDLLRALLAPARADRPRHALDISRMIAAVGQPRRTPCTVVHLPRPHAGYGIGKAA